MGSTLLVGSTIGRFRVDRLLGRGGMGAVYAAFDEKLERDVALKVLTEEGDYAIQKKRLLREARLAAKLQHPNIATVYEVDELDGHLLIVMELLEGSALRKILMQRKVSIDEAISIARDVARALAKAHAAGVIHRDIKPENIFVTTPSPDTMLAKVLDFGLARQRPGVGVSEEHTSTGSTRGDMWGTPGYVSPEQAHGLPVDVRTDIFSFGVVLYEMLAGIKPFRGENPVAIMLAATRQEPRPLREIFPAIPVEVEEIVRRCMKKNRDERYQDGAELSAALEGYVRGAAGAAKLANVVGSSPSLPLLTLEELNAAEIPSTTIADHAPTTGGSAAVELTADPEPPPLEQQRVEHMKIVASIGAGVAVALVVVIVALAWVSPSRSRTTTSTGDPTAAVASSASDPTAAVTSTPAPPPVDIDLPDDPPADSPPAEPATAKPEPAHPTAATAEPSAPGEPSTARATTPSTALTAKRPPTTVPKGKPSDCADPFTYDKGVKIPKRHCL